LGASTPAIGCLARRRISDAIYQYPGGWIADHLGRQRAFLIFLASPSAGYIVYLFSRSWPLLFLAACVLMAWQSMPRRSLRSDRDSLPREDGQWALL